jgi:hypothetical protein
VLQFLVRDFHIIVFRLIWYQEALVKKSVGYDKPLLTELSLLLDVAHGFSEPDPPAQNDPGDGDDRRTDDQQESDSFEWL